VLAPGGSLYLSAPVGRNRLEFNAHRIHTPAQVIEMFSGLETRHFAAEDDSGKFIDDAQPGVLANAAYACGMFWFQKLERRPGCC
jgi:hypothetical protein